MNDFDSLSVAVVSGLRCTFWRGGNGRPLVLIHGWGQSISCWGNLLSELAQANRVYALDLPGFGGSDEPRSHWDEDDYADFVHSFCTEMGIEKPIILGHSFGGRIAASFAKKYPTHMLVVYSTSSASRTSLLRVANSLLIKALCSLMPKTLYRAQGFFFHPSSYTNVTRVDRVRAQRMLSIYYQLHSTRKSETYHAVRCPVVFVYGDKDWIASSQGVESFAREFPQADLRLLSDAGHFAHVTHPVVFSQLLRSVLSPREDAAGPT